MTTPFSPAPDGDPAMDGHVGGDREPGRNAMPGRRPVPPLVVRPAAVLWGLVVTVTGVGGALWLAVWTATAPDGEDRTLLGVLGVVVCLLLTLLLVALTLLPLGRARPSRRPAATHRPATGRAEGAAVRAEPTVGAVRARGLRPVKGALAVLFGGVLIGGSVIVMNPGGEKGVVVSSARIADATDRCHEIGGRLRTAAEPCSALAASSSADVGIDTGSVVTGSLVIAFATGLCLLLLAGRDRSGPTEDELRWLRAADGPHGRGS